MRADFHFRRSEFIIERRDFRIVKDIPTVRLQKYKSEKRVYLECLTETLHILDLDLRDVIIFGDMAQGVSLIDGTEETNPYRLLLKTPDECRKAMVVVLHLVEKSLQCLKSEESRRFTEESSIKNKIGPEIRGVFQLLTSLGFERRLYRLQNEHAWYFPEKSCLRLLEKASERLLSFLNLPHIFYVAFAKLFDENPSDKEEIFSILRKIFDDLRHISTIQYEIRVEKALYEEVAGVAELFAALGLDRIDSSKGINILRTKRLELTRTKLQHTLCCIDALLEKSTDADEISYDNADFRKLQISEFVSNSLVKNHNIPTIQNSTKTDFSSKSPTKLSALKKSNAKKYATMRNVSSKKQHSMDNNKDGYKSDAEINNCRSDKSNDGYSSQNENFDRRQRLSSTNNLNSGNFGDENSNDDDEIFHSVREALEKFRSTKSRQKHDYARLETPTPPDENDYVQPMPDEDYGNFCGKEDTVEYCSTTVFCGKYNVREANINFNLNISDTQVHLDLV